MRVKIIFVFAALLLASIKAAPSEEVEKSEVKTDAKSPLEEVKAVEDVERTKKSTDKKKSTTLCKEVKTEDGKSFLQCNEEGEDMMVAASDGYGGGSSYGGGGYSAPASYGVS
jgi:hypothetical protein